MTRITTVIFDMFNTLVRDGEDYWEASFERIVQEQGLAISGSQLRREWSPEDQRFREQRTREGATFQTYTDAWLKGFHRVFAKLGLPGDASGALGIVLEDMGLRPIHSETVDALVALQQHCRIAILSNADDKFLDPVVQRLAVRFDAVLSSEEARCYKPGAWLFHQMLGRLEATAEEAIYVGDRQYEDVHGASQAGLRSAWINRAKEPLDPNLSSPHYYIESLLELPDLVKGTV